MTLRNYSKLFAGATIKTVDITCHDGETRGCRIEQYIEGYIAFVACFDGDYSNRHLYASAANALRAAQTWRDLPATPAPAIEPMTDAQLIEEYTAIFNACASIDEINAVAADIDFVSLNGDTVAAITSTFEQVKDALWKARYAYDVRIGIVGPRGGSNTFVGDLTLGDATLDAARAEVARLYRIGAAALCNVYVRYVDLNGKFHCDPININIDSPIPAVAPASPDGLYWLKCKRCGSIHHVIALVDAIYCNCAMRYIEVADVTPIKPAPQATIETPADVLTRAPHTHDYGIDNAGAFCIECGAARPATLTMQVYGTPAHGKTAYTNATPDVIAPAPKWCEDCGETMHVNARVCMSCHEKRGAFPHIPLIDQQRAQLVDRAIETGKTYTDQHLIDYPLLRTVALDYVSEYTGANTFVRDLAQRLDESGALSHRQLRGALNALVAEAKIARYENSDRLSKADAIEFDRRHNDGGGSAVEEYYIDLRTKEDKAIDSAGDAAIDPDSANEVTPVVPNGIYTIIFDTNIAGQPQAPEYVTLRVRNAPDFFKDVKKGTQVVQYLIGADNENDYKSFSFLIGDKIAVWKIFSHNPMLGAALRRLLADPMGMAGNYVKRSGKCFVCNRTLTVPESIAGGIGPVCREKIAALGFTFKLEPSPAMKARATMSRADAQAGIDELFD